jgi:hypothetical protein
MTLAAVTWTLLTIVFIRKDKRKWGKVLHTFQTNGKIFWKNSLMLLAKQGKPLCPSKQGAVSSQIKF